MVFSRMSSVIIKQDSLLPQVLFSVGKSESVRNKRQFDSVRINIDALIIKSGSIGRINVFDFRFLKTDTIHHIQTFYLNLSDFLSVWQL